MPPKRRGKASAASSRTSNVKRVLTAEEHEINQNLQLIIQDMDKGIDTLVAELETAAEGVGKSIMNMFMINLIKIPLSIKNMRLDEYMEQVRLLVLRFSHQYW